MLLLLTPDYTYFAPADTSISSTQQPNIHQHDRGNRLIQSNRQYRCDPGGLMRLLWFLHLKQQHNHQPLTGYWSWKRN